MMKMKFKERHTDMKNGPLVSIVTPCYNSEQFIESCIESVLAQDYPYVEHIVQDGASTDGTVEILKRYTGKIQLVSEPDKGQADGLNKALKRSQGDIILVLNADDELLPHAARWGVENMEKYPDAGVVYGNQYTINAEGKIIGAYRYDHTYDFHKLLCVELVPPAQAAFIRRNHFEQVGLYADTELDTCPDYEMWVRIGLKFPMIYLPGFIARYRWHTDSEGRQKDIIHKMVHAKRSVMDRVFDNPATPPELKALRPRAYASLNMWAAGMFVGIKHGMESAWNYLYLALKNDFSFKRVREVINVILVYSAVGYVYRCFMRHYIKTVIRIKRMLGIPVEVDEYCE
jgi:glycosyltransferase involved in cell wall biosynthesis